jgi:hypothetical protein
MTTSNHRHTEINNGHNNHSKDDEIDSGKYLFISIYSLLPFI